MGAQRYVNQYMIESLLAKVREGWARRYPAIQRPFVWDAIQVRDRWIRRPAGHPSAT